MDRADITDSTDGTDGTEVTENLTHKEFCANYSAHCFHVLQNSFVDGFIPGVSRTQSGVLFILKYSVEGISSLHASGRSQSYIALQLSKYSMTMKLFPGK